MVDKPDGDESREKDIFELGTDEPEQSATPPIEASEDPAESPPAEPESEAEKPESRQVPLAELMKEREKARFHAERLNAEMAALRVHAENQIRQYQQQLQQGLNPPKPEELPDPYTDPEAYFDSRIQKAEASFTSRLLDMSEASAVKQHGKQLVDEAFEWVQSSGVGPRLSQSPDFYGDAVNLYQQAKAFSEIGNPTEWVAKKEAEIREKVLAEMKQGKPTTARIPGTLADATATGAGYVASTGSPLDDIFDTNRRRR